MKDGTHSENTGIEMLVSIRERIASDYSDDAAKSFVKCIDNYLDGNGSIDECLYIKPERQGSPTMLSKYYFKKRNGALIEAREHCFAGKEWKISGEIAKAIEDFSKRWSEFGCLNKPDAEWSELSKCLFNAFKYSEKCTGRDMPHSQKQIHDIYLSEINHAEASGTTRVDYFKLKLP